MPPCLAMAIGAGRYIMEKKLKREKVIESPKEVAKLISLIDKYGLSVVKIGKNTEYKSFNQFRAKNTFYGLHSSMIIELKETKLLITTKYYEGKPCTYIFNLNKEPIFAASGLRCFTEFSKAFKLPKAKTYDHPELEKWFNDEKGSYSCSASPIIGFNPNFEGKIIEDCYEYDLNSAYSAAMFKQMPDLYHPLWKKDMLVKEGFVGFYINDRLTMVEPGGHADVTFPLINTPDKLKEFCEKWYNKKRTSTGVERLEAKAMLNLPIGYCQRFNPFMRSYIVHTCNNEIIKLIDKDSLFWNTDAIFSKVRRTDLDIGEGIGQFKEIHYKTVRYLGNVYQLDRDIPVYRGVPKAWFRRFEVEMGRPFDILLDDLPNAKNMYSFNWETLELEKNYD